MKRIALILSIGGMIFLFAGCAPSMESIVEKRVPELRRLDIGAYDLGEFKNGQSTPFRMLPVVKGEPRSVAFTTTPESRRFNIVLDDGRIFKFDDEKDLASLAGTRLDKQSFYLEFRQDMRMTVIISRPTVQMGSK